MQNQLQEAEERRVELLLEINVLKEHTASPQEESAGNLNGNIKAVPNGEVPDAKLRDSFSHVTSFEVGLYVYEHDDNVPAIIGGLCSRSHLRPVAVQVPRWWMTWNTKSAKYVRTMCLRSF